MSAGVGALWTPEDVELGQVVLARVAVGFAAVLRESGLEVPISSVGVFRSALGALGGAGSIALYWAGRSIFVRDRDGVGRYDVAFQSFFGGVRLPHSSSLGLEIASVDDRGRLEVETGNDHVASGPGPGASQRERLSTMDFAELSVVELAMTHQLMSEIAIGVPERVTRRQVRSGSGRTSIDLRSTARGALRRGGDLGPFQEHHRRSRPRRLVAICDISGSMEPYAREFMRFLHVCVAGRTEVETFAIGTRLTRLTRQLRRHDPDAALAGVAAEVEDWAGGTRLGEGLREFNDRYGIRGMARGAHVLICSDGIDRGDPEMLGAEVARLHRVAERVVWVNPLKATPGYAPTTRGMAAARPHVDDFVEGHSLAALVTAVRGLARADRFGATRRD